MNDQDTIMKLILHGGNARSSSYEALNEAENFNFIEADKFLEDAEKEFLKAHKYQTELIQAQNDKIPPTFLMIHAQDHVMTAQAEIQLIKRLIKQLETAEKLESRIEQLEESVFK